MTPSTCRVCGCERHTIPRQFQVFYAGEYAKNQGAGSQCREITAVSHYDAARQRAQGTEHTNERLYLVVGPEERRSWGSRVEIVVRIFRIRELSPGVRESDFIGPKNGHYSLTEVDAYGQEL